MDINLAKILVRFVCNEATSFEVQIILVHLGTFEIKTI